MATIDPTVIVGFRNRAELDEFLTIAKSEGYRNSPDWHIDETPNAIRIERSGKMHLSKINTYIDIRNERVRNESDWYGSYPQGYTFAWYSNLFGEVNVPVESFDELFDI